MRIMRTLFWLSVSVLATGTSFGQTPAPAAPRPAQTQPAPAQAAPAPPAPAARRAAAPAPPSRSGIAITVTDPHGKPIPGVHVDIAGASDRNGDTDASGQINFVGMQPDTYRARFGGDAVTPFEREVIVRSGQPTVIDVTLSPAPPPAAAPPPRPAPAAAAPVVGPPGMPQVLSIIDLAEKQLSGNQARRETLVSCSGNTRTLLVLLNQDQPERLYDRAETEYYVVAGQGAVRLNGRDTPLAAGSYVSLPRNTSHSIVHRGNRPLILLAVLNGEPCEQAK
jgi:mannose-6-phosphate isomerase-like protein (cupin superfamily)